MKESFTLKQDPSDPVVNIMMESKMKQLVLFLVILLSLPSMTTLASASEAGEIEVEGEIELLTETEITVRSTVFQLNSGTEYEGENEEVLSREDFAVGDYVEVEGRKVAGILVAREVEKDSPDDSDDDDDSSDSSSDDDDDGSSVDDDDDDSSSADDDDDSFSDDDDNSSDDDDSSSSSAEKSKKAKKNSETKGQSSKNSGRKVKVKSQLKLSSLRLQVQRNAKLNKKDRGKDRLDVNLKVDLPSTLPAIVNEAAAALADLRITFSREGQAFATCAFAFTGRDDSLDATDPVRAHFRVKLKARKKPSGDVLTNKNGLCDIDASSSGDQPGIPEIEKGDTYSVYEVTTTADNEFLAGEL